LPAVLHRASIVPPSDVNVTTPVGGFVVTGTAVGVGLGCTVAGGGSTAPGDVGAAPATEGVTDAPGVRSGTAAPGRVTVAAGSSGAEPVADQAEIDGGAADGTSTSSAALLGSSSHSSTDATPTAATPPNSSRFRGRTGKGTTTGGRGAGGFGAATRDSVEDTCAALGRSAGSLRRHWLTSSVTCGGTSPSRGIGAGSTYTWAVSICVVLSTVHGDSPASNRYISTPRAYTSEAGSTWPPVSRSGAR
jgi:hypothetical protein